jgi:hypothetical protein
MLGSCKQAAGIAFRATLLQPVQTSARQTQRLNSFRLLLRMDILLESFHKGVPNGRIAQDLFGARPPEIQGTTSIPTVVGPCAPVKARSEGLIVMGGIVATTCYLDSLLIPGFFRFVSTSGEV